MRLLNANYPVPTDLNIDYDNDGYVDNVCFIVRGYVGTWNSLLWPHKWALYDRAVRINGKRVWTFNFQLADATSYFNTSVMCHEMNHSLGAPDLYHYYYGESLSPVGMWDLMENNAMPPQHCGAYMKMKYGHWLDEIPEITEPGIYTLNPISSATPTNIAYKIATDNPDQFYVLEYRDNTSLFESALPGSGLLIYRIDTRFEGNAGYDPSNGIYDEIYLFRPGGSTSENGSLYTAYFSADAGRTEFNSSTSAYPFFTDGTPDYNFRIFDITSAGNTISFSYDLEDVTPEGLYLGDGGTTANRYLPSYNLYKYSFTQQIYTSDELGEAGIITSMAFYNDGAQKTRSYDFYMKNTTKSSFSGGTDWVAVSPTDLVFSGTVTLPAGRWTVINFDVPFAYDGTSNVVLVADDNTGEQSSAPHMTCLVYNASRQAIRVYNNYTNYVPYNPTQYSGTVMNVKNQLILNKTTPVMQVFADYYPNDSEPTSSYVKVRWGNGLSYVEDFERGDFSLFDWQLDRVYPWAITSEKPYEGGFCMKSSNEGVQGSTSAMEIMIAIPNEGQISFFSKISSESNYDFGRFYIDGIEQGAYSGNGSWGERTFAITAGVHTFKWAYTKDNSLDRFDDCFYVDYIRFYVSDEKSGNTAYCVYRAKCDGSGLQMIADNVTQNYYIDNEWRDLEPGLYKYGVCAALPCSWSNCIERLNAVQTIELSAGWNWISLYVEVGDPAEALQMLEAALGGHGLKISGVDDYTTYANGEWGAMGDLEELTNDQMYMVLVDEDIEVTLEGTTSNPADYSITIYPGWTWIGFPSAEAIAIEVAFADFEAEEGDKIMGVDGYSIYGDGGWNAMGDLEELIPGSGYMYFSNGTQPKTLVIKSGAKAKADSSRGKRKE